MSNSVNSFLRTSNLLVGTAFFVRLFLAIVAMFFVCVLVAVVADAAFTLPVWARIGVDVLVVVAGGLAIGRLWKTIRQNRFDARRVARSVEHDLDVHDNTLINAIDLQESRSEYASNELVERTLQTSSERVYRMSPFDTLRMAPVLKFAGLAVLAFVVLAASFFALPKVYSRVVPRYLDPLGNHPAYTSLDFVFTTNPETIYEGDPVQLGLEIKGAYLPDVANIVFIEQVNDTKQTASQFDPESGSPMLNLGENQYSYTIDRAKKSQMFFVDTPHGRSDLFNLNVLNLPRFEKTILEFVYPEYTQFESKRSVLNNRGIHAIEGTHLTVQCFSNIPLAAGTFRILDSKTKQEVSVTQLIPDGDDRLTPDVDDRLSVSGTIGLQRGDRFEISLLGANGAASKQTVTGRIIISPDRKPKLAILSPDAHVIAVENWKIPVEIQATDDVGLKRLQLLPAVNGFRPYPRDLMIENTGAKPGENGGANSFANTVATSTYEFDLQLLGARAGDLVTYFATATDHHPSGEHFTKTATHVIQVISVADYRELARRNYRMDDVLEEINEIRAELRELGEKRDEALEKLLELQQKLENGEELSQKDLNQITQLQQELDEFAERADDLGNRMEERAEQTTIYEFEDTYKEQLEEMSKQLLAQSENADQLNEQLKKFDQDPTKSNQAKMDEALEKFKKENQPFDEQTQRDQQELERDLERLQQAEKLMEQVARLKNVAQQQRLVADQMAEFQNLDELNEEQKQRLKQLAKQQDLLQEELKDVMEKMEKAADEAKDNFPKAGKSVEELLEKMKSEGIVEDQQQAAKSGHDGAGKQAHQLAEKAAKALEGLQCEDCNSQGMGQEMGQGDGPLKIPKDKMKKSLEQLAGSLQIPGLKNGQKQNGDGQGRRGSMAQARLFGPHLPSNSKSEMRRGGRQANQSGKGEGVNPLVISGAAENLTPQERTKLEQSGSLLDGVPAGYIDHAKAYLKRIAETDE